MSNERLQFDTLIDELPPPTSSSFEEEDVLVSTLLRSPPAQVMLTFQSIGPEVSSVLLPKD